MGTQASLAATDVSAGPVAWHAASGIEKSRFLADYARNPVNLLLISVVPVVFAAAAAGPMGSSTRGTNRRLVISGWGAARLVTVRLAAGLALAVLASAAALHPEGSFPGRKAPRRSAG